MRDLTDNKLKELKRELAERILHLAAFLDNCFDSGNEGELSNNIVRYIDDKPLHLYDEEYDQIDLNKYLIGRSLPYYYDYAYNAICKRWVDEDVFDGFSDNNKDKDIFKEFLELTNPFGIVSSVGEVNWGVWEAKNKRPVQRESGLLEMSSLFNARRKLDFDDKVKIADIALLTNMIEKSVRNALSDEGENKLQSADGEHIEKSEALRWMRGRKSGFRETTFIDFGKDKLPEYLRHIDIGPFIKKRLEKFYDLGDSLYSYPDAAKDLKYSGHKLSSILDNIDNLPIKDTHLIAKVIQVDPAWFTEQVFTALFPEQMELILHRKEIEYNALPDESKTTPIEVTLTEKGIKNGYIDIPAKFSYIFPKDSFAERATGTPGNPIELRFGNEIRITEMRVKSSITISPRARFGGHFNKVINAKPGDTLRIIKVDDRVFEIKHIPSN